MAEHPNRTSSGFVDKAHTLNSNAMRPSGVAALNTLNLSPSDRAWLDATLSLSAAEDGTRAVFLQIIDRYARLSLAPSTFRTYQEVRAHLPDRGPFSMIALRDVVIALASIAHLEHPGLPLARALRMSASAITMEGLEQMPVFGSFYRTCFGDLMTFFELIAGTTFFWERGRTSLITTASPNAVVLRFEALPMAALAAGLEGFYHGCMARLGLNLTATTDLISPTLAEIHLRWTAA